MYVDQVFDGVLGSQYADVQNRITVVLPTFDDVPAGAWYCDAAQWAAARGITTGATETTFEPAAPCTRANILTFLWRAAGQPAAEGQNPFTDLAGGEYYYDAALWACEQGLIDGTVFDAAAGCTRGDVVTYLWMLAGSPVPAGQSPFADVASDAPFAQAAQWAVDQNVTTGTSDTTFSPDTVCSRGEIVTFLYRYFAQ